jgi:hypothetical protein
MKLGYCLLLLVIFMSCNQSGLNDRKIKLVRNKIEGKWMHVGLFKKGIPMYDTLYHRIPNLDSLKSEVIYGIWTDSGKYEHVYNEKTNSLVRIDSSKELEIFSFSFFNDSIGVCNQFQTEPDELFKKALSNSGYKQKFKIFFKDTLPNIEFENTNGTAINTACILSTSSDKLELQWNSKITEKFERLDIP